MSSVPPRLREMSSLLPVHFLLREGKAVLPCGEEHLHRGQVPALDPEQQAGTGKGGFPGDLKMPTAKAIGRAGGSFFLINSHVIFPKQF